jgi:hypothetical protein
MLKPTPKQFWVAKRNCFREGCADMISGILWSID